MGGFLSAFLYIGGFISTSYDIYCCEKFIHPTELLRQKFESKRLTSF